MDDFQINCRNAMVDIGTKQNHVGFRIVLMMVE